jgi:hypothetical protein
LSVHRAAILSILLALVCAGAAVADPSPAGLQLPGVWQGELPDWVGQKVRVVLVVTRESGTLVARMHSPDQGGQVYTAQTVRLTERRVEIYLTMMMAASFDGTLSDDGQQLRGHWTQDKKRVPMVFQRVAAP